MKNLTYADQRLIWRKRRERALALYENGLTLGEIAEQLQCTRQRVHQMIAKMRPQPKRAAP